MAYQAIDRGRIGARVRMVREAQARSLRWVGKQLGVSHQQVMKYESGSCSIPSERLATLAVILKTSVGMLSGEGRANDTELALLDDETTRLLLAFSKIKHPGSRMYVLKLVETWPLTAK